MWRSVTELRLSQRQSLTASWLLRLVREAGYAVPQTSLSTAPFIIGPPDDFNITVAPQDSTPWITAVASDQTRQEEIDKLVERSGELASGDLISNDDFGGVVWYTCTLAGEQPNPADPMFFSRMQEMLNTQVRIMQWLRLGEYILLHFREEIPQGGVQANNLLFPPRPLVDVYVAVPGPIDGPFTRPIAYGYMEVVAAICTFALGRPVNLPPHVGPVQDEILAELETRRADTTILTLARKGIGLDLLFGLLALGDEDSWRRLRGALLSYDAAIRQQREQVALIIYVVAAECLTNPFQPWKTERLTTRFIKFFDGLMPDHLDSMVQHGNFEQAFDIARGSKSPRRLRGMLLDSLYGFRSEPVHEGLAMAYEGFAFSGLAGQRRMFASWFAESAILSYLQSPRTSLIGHPATASDAEPEQPTSSEPEQSRSTQTTCTGFVQSLFTKVSRWRP
ncbi:hypothetical protein MYSI104531_20185 [Mycobacterium simiae]